MQIQECLLIYYLFILFISYHIFILSNFKMLSEFFIPLYTMTDPVLTYTWQKQKNWNW